MIHCSNPSGAVYQVRSEQDFNQHIQNAGDKLVLVQFSNTYCGPCDYMASYLVYAALKYTDKIAVLNVNVDNVGDLNNYDVEKLPTYLFFKSGRVVKKTTTANPTKIDKYIAKLID